MKYLFALPVLALFISLFAGNVFCTPSLPTITAFNITAEYPVQIDEGFTLTGASSALVNNSAFSLETDGRFMNITPLTENTTYWIQLNVTNYIGNSTYDVIFVNITPDTTAPTISAHNITVEYPSDVSVQFNITDAGGVDNISVNDTGNFSIDQTGFFQNITSLSTGTYYVDIIANDTNNNTATLSITINIAVQTPPEITASDIVAENPKTIHKQFTATDFSGIDSWSINNTDNFTINITTGMFENTTALETETDYHIQLAVNDTFNNTAFANITVRVENSTAPALNLQNMSIESNDIIGVQLNGTDNVGIDSFSLAKAYYVNGTGNATNNITVSNFTLNSTGFLNSTSLVQGRTYWLIIELNDTVNNTASDTISIAVTAPHTTTTTSTSTTATTTTVSEESDTEDTVFTTSTSVSTTTTTTIALTEKTTISADAKANEPKEIFVAENARVGIVSLNLTVKEDMPGILFEINRVMSPTSATPSGNVYKYIEIKTDNLSNDNISSLFIRFHVEKSWLETNNLTPESVQLHRYSQEHWSGLKTTMTGNNTEYYEYEAVSPGFSYFAITAGFAYDDLLTGLFFSETGIAGLGIGSYAAIAVTLIAVIGIAMKKKIKSTSKSNKNKLSFSPSLSTPSISKPDFSKHKEKLKKHASKIKSKFSKNRT